MSHPGEPVLYRVPTEPEGLEWARNAVLSWALARSRRLRFHLAGAGPRERDLLNWLGLDWDAEQPEGLEIEVGPFNADIGLEVLRDRGVVAEAVLATLAACGWRAPRGRSGLTRAELLVRFTPEGLISEPVDWDPELLEENQRLFMTELTPREILERTLGDRLNELGEETVMALEGVALLYGEEAENLNQCRDRLEFFFTPPDPPERSPSPETLGALERLDPWESTTLEQVLEQLPDRQDVELATIGRTEPFAADLFALLGREETLRRLRNAFKPDG